MFTDMLARHVTKVVTHSTVAAFAVKGATRLAVREPIRKLRRDAMKSRSSSPGMSKPSFMPQPPRAQSSQASQQSSGSQRRGHTLAPPLPKPKRPASF